MLVDVVKNIVKVCHDYRWWTNNVKNVSLFVYQNWAMKTKKGDRKSWAEGWDDPLVDRNSWRLEKGFKENEDRTVLLTKKTHESKHTKRSRAGDRSRDYRVRCSLKTSRRRDSLFLTELQEVQVSRDLFGLLDKCCCDDQHNEYVNDSVTAMCRKVKRETRCKRRWTSLPFLVCEVTIIINDFIV